MLSGTASPLARGIPELLGNIRVEAKIERWSGERRNTVKVKIIREECTGAAVCELLCPEVFKVGDDEIAEVISDEPDEALWPQVKEAAARCPSMAIVLEE